jgi:hypothetical protein
VGGAGAARRAPARALERRVERSQSLERSGIMEPNRAQQLMAERYH